MTRHHLTNGIASSNPKEHWGTYIFILLIALIWAIWGSSPVNLFSNYTISYDEPIYKIMARTLLAGKELYVDSWDHKGPLLYIVYAIGILISDGSNLGFAVLQFIFNSFILVFAYKIARLYLTQSAAFVATIILPLIFGAFSVQTTEILLIYQLCSLYFFLRKHVQDRDENIFPILGLCCTATLLTRFNICLFWLPILIFEAIHTLKNNGIATSVKRLLISGLYCLALAIPVLCLVQWDAFIDAYVTYNLNVSGRAKPSPLNDFVAFLRLFMRPSSPLYPHDISFQIIRIVMGLFSFAACFITWPKFKQSKGLYITILASAFLTGVTSFKGPYLIDYYYICLYPFYILSITFTLRLLHKHVYSKLHLKQTAKWGLITLIYASVITGIASIHIKTALPVIKQQRALVTAIQERTADAESLLVASYVGTEIYNMKGTLPPINHFYEVHSDFFDEMVACIASKQFEYIICNSDRHREVVYDAIEQAGYQELPPIRVNISSNDCYRLFVLPKQEQ